MINSRLESSEKSALMHQQQQQQGDAEDMLQKDSKSSNNSENNNNQDQQVAASTSSGGAAVNLIPHRSLLDLTKLFSCSFSYALVYASLQNIVIAKEVDRLAQTSQSSFVAVCAALAALAQLITPIVGALSDRSGERLKYLRIGTVLVIVGIACFYLCNSIASLVVLFVSSVVLSIGLSTVYSIITVLLHDQVSEAQTGLASATMAGLATVGAGFSYALFAIGSSLSVVFLWYAVASLVCFAITIITINSNSNNMSQHHHLHHRRQGSDNDNNNNNNHHHHHHEGGDKLDTTTATSSSSSLSSSSSSSSSTSSSSAAAAAVVGDELIVIDSSSSIDNNNNNNNSNMEGEESVKRIKKQQHQQIVPSSSTATSSTPNSPSSSSSTSTSSLSPSSGLVDVICHALSVPSPQQHPDFALACASRAAFNAGLACQSYMIFFFRDASSISSSTSSVAPEQIVSRLAILALLGSLLMALPAGYLSDRFGKKTVLFAASFFSIIAIMAFAFVTEAWHFDVAGFVLGVGNIAFLSCDYALGVLSLPRAKTGDQRVLNPAKDIGIFSLSASVGALIGQLLFGLILERFSFIPSSATTTSSSSSSSSSSGSTLSVRYTHSGFVACFSAAAFFFLVSSICAAFIKGFK